MEIHGKYINVISLIPIR